MFLNSWRLDYNWWTSCFIIPYTIAVDWLVGLKPPNPHKPTPVSEDSISLDWVTPVDWVTVQAPLNTLNWTIHQTFLNYPLHLFCTLNQTILNCLLHLFCTLSPAILNHTLNHTLNRFTLRWVTSCKSTLQWLTGSHAVISHIEILVKPQPADASVAFLATEDKSEYIFKVHAENHPN